MFTGGSESARAVPDPPYNKAKSQTAKPGSYEVSCPPRLPSGGKFAVGALVARTI